MPCTPLLSTAALQGGMAASGILPEGQRDRDAWILNQRGERNPLAADRAYGAILEEERGESGEMIPTATVFLTNRECPFRCLMCDLWKNTLPEVVPTGAIPQQIQRALTDLPPARQIKLYNSGSFFDPGAIPPDDYDAVAALVAPFERVIVECHPAFIGERTLRFQRLLQAPLEVAIGLETAHPEVLQRLNKRMTRETFARAAAFLEDSGIALRVFLLLRPPFLTEQEGLEWAKRSLDFAFDCGAAVCTVIPTRGGNGAMEALSAAGEFAPPRIESLVEVVSYGVGLGCGRVFADLWDIEKLRRCNTCFPARLAQLESLNRTQQVPPTQICPDCNC